MVDEKKVDENKVEVPVVAAEPEKEHVELTREEQAKGIMFKHMWGNAAVGLLPIPVLDIFTVGGVQLHMLKRISAVYDVPFNKDFVKPLVASFAGALGYDLVGKGLMMGLVKFVPPFGFLAGVLSFPVLSAASTYAVGKVFIQHFEAGGTLLDLEPSRMKDYFARYYREGIEVATSMGEKAKNAEPSKAK